MLILFDIRRWFLSRDCWELLIFIKSFKRGFFFSGGGGVVFFGGGYRFFFGILFLFFLVGW